MIFPGMRLLLFHAFFIVHLFNIMYFALICKFRNCTQRAPVRTTHALFVYFIIKVIFVIFPGMRLLLFHAFVIVICLISCILHLYANFVIVPKGPL